MDSVKIILYGLNLKYIFAQDELQGNEATHATEVKDLKTEIATLKLNRLVSLPTSSGTNSPRLGSAHKGELDRLSEELTVKSLMIVELRKEIALLKVEKESRPTSARLKPKAPPLNLDKEKEYQDRIKALQKQVRTLQRILYNKESTTAGTTSTSSTNLNRVGSSSARASLASRGRAMSLGKFDITKKAVSSPNIDTQAVQKLEAQLEKERTEFQRRLSEKQKIIADNEVQINTLKVELSKVSKDQPDAASETESAILEQLQNRLLSQSEIIQTLKEQLSSVKAIESERDGYKREISLYETRVKELQRKLTRAETMAKPNFRAGSNKEVQKPSMNQEKEKDYQKQIQNFQKQVRTLQKILYNKNPGSAPPVPNRSMGASESKEDLRANVTSTRPKSLGPFKRPAAPAPTKSNYNSQMLESTFEQERIEFEKLLMQKQMQIEEKDRQIRELKSKLSATIEENAWIAHESTTEKATFEEFRAKLSAQNKIIDSLKNRLASYANVEAERTMLKREIHHLEFRVQDLQRKLARAESLARPESEVLASLSEKVEDLHTRYYYRERQLDTLLDRLSLKTGQSFGSPRSLHSYNANPSSINGNSTDFPLGPTSSTRSNNIDLGELSPSATLHLIPHRDVPEI
ncbi:unnamed protein product [Allacma fusca]|uniref:Uncharacterized protein n=1 Tax=Allacma fusca TaxID=39272 RepID=A0A8J2PXZ2_9HEXA|nr:unnamed protein product [Allacma fusca]